MRDSLSDQLNRIEDALSILLRKVDAMSAALDALKLQVEQTTTLEQSAIVLIQGLAAQIESLKNDPVEIQGVVDRLRASAQSLAEAVAANTTPAPTPPTP